MHSPRANPTDLDARYEAALELLLDRINYERNDTLPEKWRGLKLDRMRQLLARLGNPQQRLPVVHVAGTKGKGSTCAMVAAALSACGRRTGLFTSPHLDAVEQRLAIDGEACRPDELADLVETVWPAVRELDEIALREDRWANGPTWFEITTALAMLHFDRRQVDAAVLEVGMGGRLDSTNVCQPLVTAITSISFDHTRQLGHTLAAIAGEKAGIIKPGVPVISGVLQDEPRRVIEEKARRSGARLVQLGRDFDFRYQPPKRIDDEGGSGRLDFNYHLPGDYRGSSGVALHLLGTHQGANAAVALAVLEELRRLGWELPEPAVRRGLVAARVPARIEVVARRPAVLIDAAHNVASVEALLEVLQQSFTGRPRTLVFATTEDKDLRGMLALLLPRFERVVLTRYRNNPRGVPVEELAAIAAPLSEGPCELAADPAGAWQLVREVATVDEVVCIAGSFFLAAEMRPLVAQRPAVVRARAAGVGQPPVAVV